MKRMSIVPIALVVFSVMVLADAVRAQVTVVKGTLLDVNGQPSKYALVGIASTAGGNAEKFVPCDEKGGYSIELKRRGLNFLMYTMPSHLAVRVPLQNNKKKQVTIDVTLAPYAYTDHFTEVGIYGSFNNFTRNPLEKMVKQADGTYTYEITSDQDEVRFQLVGIEINNRTMNAPDAMSYQPDSSGDFHSVAKVKDGKVTVVFDPSRLLRKDAVPKIVFKNSNNDERIFAVYDEYSRMNRNAIRDRWDYQAAKKDPREYHYDGGTYLSELPKKIESEKSPDAKELLKLAYVAFAQHKPVGYDKDKARAYYESVSPKSPQWEIIPEAFSSFYTIFPHEKWIALQEAFLKDTKSLTIKISILFGKISNAKFSGDQDEFKRIHALILSDYKDVKELQQLVKMFPLETNITVGGEIPDYEIVSMNDPAEKYSKSAMLGKIYLIDFWATWCGGCVNEMEVLHKAYEKYKDKGLEIVSLSMDGKTEDVDKFRAEKWKMPWKHGHLGAKGGETIVKSFEVVGVPKPILVSAEGKILALDREVIGENLDKTLSKYFK